MDFRCIFCMGLWYGYKRVFLRVVVWANNADIFIFSLECSHWPNSLYGYNSLQNMFSVVTSFDYLATTEITLCCSNQNSKSWMFTEPILINSVISYKLPNQTLGSSPTSSIPTQPSTYCLVLRIFQILTSGSISVVWLLLDQSSWPSHKVDEICVFQHIVWQPAGSNADFCFW